MIHPAYKKVEIAERYLKKLGKFKDRNQAKKTFESLKKYDTKLIAEIINEIHREAKSLLLVDGRQKKL